MIHQTHTNLSEEFYHNLAGILKHLQTDPCHEKKEICSITLYGFYGMWSSSNSHSIHYGAPN